MEIPQPCECKVLNPRTGKTGVLRVSNAGFAVVFELYLGRQRIGYANCASLGQHEIMLCDLRIGEPQTETAQHWLARWQRRPQHRHRGWGTLLLLAVIEEARRSGFRTVSAEVTPADRAANTDLLGWYQRHGFQHSGRPASKPHWTRLQRRL